MKKHFKNKNKTIVGNISFFAWAIVASGGVGGIAFSFIYFDAKADMTKSILVGALAAIALFTIYYLRFRKGCDITVTDKEVLITRGDKIIHTFSHSSCSMSSNVVKHYTNGVPTGTDRYLVVREGLGVKEYKTDLRKRDFDQLMAAVMQYANIEHPQEDVQPYSNQPSLIQRFEIKKELAKSTNSLKVIIPIYILAALVYYYLTVSPPDERMIPIYDLFFGTITVIVGVLVFVPLIRLFSLRRMPRIIEVYGDKLIIDGQIFRNSDIANIVMTPTSNDYIHPTKKDLLIVTRDGAKFKYKLKLQRMGFLTPKKDMVFREYDQFADMLSREFLRSGRFVFDL